MTVAVAPDVAVVLDNVLELIEKLLDHIDGGSAESTRVDEIEHRPVSGFVPFTDGGYDGWVTFPFLRCETSESVKLIAPFVDKDYQEAVDDFIAEHKLPEGTDVHEHELWSDWLDEWEQADDSTWFVKVRAILYTPNNRRNLTGHDEVFFCFGVNDDFTYGRDSIGWLPNVGTHWLWEETVRVTDLTTEKLAEIETNIRQAWKDA